jgi:hypothetical protein
VHLKSPTRNATRYVDIFGVVANATVCLPATGPGVSDTIFVFEIAVSPASTTSETSNVAFSAGSSKLGNARRASVASNCVTA